MYVVAKNKYSNQKKYIYNQQPLSKSNMNNVKLLSMFMIKRSKTINDQKY